MHQRNAVPNPATMLPNFISLIHASDPLNIGRSSTLSFTETFYVMHKTGKLNQHCEDNFMEWEAPVWNQGFIENQWANLTWQWTPDNPSPGEAKERRLQILVKPGLHCSQSKTVSQQRKEEGKLSGLLEAPIAGFSWPWGLDLNMRCALRFSVGQSFPPFPAEEWAASEEVKHHPIDGQVEFHGLLELPSMFIFT